MNILDGIILGVVEGLTEFLPVSSTGHVTIGANLLGLEIDDPSVTAFTAIIQVGAIAAVLVYFRADLFRIGKAWCAGVVSKRHRDNFDYRFGWYIIVGSVPIGAVGLVAKGVITGPLRSLWVVAVALVLWSGVMIYAERVAKQERSEGDISLRDVLFIGAMQCIALIPGVSRSGATISAGLMLNLDRVAATRLAFFLSIPAITAAGAFQAIGEADAISAGVGWGPTVAGMVASFVVAYIAIAWLLKFVAGHSIAAFAWYRIPLGLLVAGLLATGVMSAT